VWSHPAGPPQAASPRPWRRPVTDLVGGHCDDALSEKQLAVLRGRKVGFVFNPRYAKSRHRA